MVKPDTVEDLKELVASRLDVAEFLDVIGYTMYELVEALEDEIRDNWDDLIKACG